LGANIGLGYRFIEPNDFALFGVNAFYDADNTWGKTYHQLSLGWEARTEWAGLFGNVYFPVGKRNQILSQSVFNERFEDNRILFDVRSRTGQSMSGLDLNVQTLLPGDFARDHQIQFTAGWYTFNGSGVEDINGVQLQLQGDVHPNITLMASYTNDKTFGSNAAVGGMFRFGTRDRPDMTLRGQLRRFVNRNYNVIVSTKSMTETGIAAINRATGNEYVVQHVGSGSGTGTYDNPFDNVADAQNAGADIIFVHEGTTLNESIVLQDGQSLIGEGSNVVFRDSRYGNFRVPGGSSTSVNTPIIDGTGIGGDLLTLANNSQVSGFHLQNSQGHGVVASNISNFKIENITIENSTDDAIFISEATDGTISNVHVDGGTNGVTLIDIDGTITLSDIFIDGVSGDGVHIDGGHGRIAFMKDLIIQNAGQSAFYVTNLETLVEVDDRGTVSTSDDITTKTPGFVTVDGLVVRNTTGGSGIHLENNEGVIAFGAVDIETKDASAFYARDTENAQILNGFLKTENAPVADVENSGINISLTKLNADGGATGLRFVDTTGKFMVYGTGDLGTGGEIKNTTDAIYTENGPMVAFQTVNFTANNAIARVDGGDALILVGSNITQTAETFIHAKNLTMLQILSSQFTNNAISSGTGILFEADKAGSFTSSVTYNKVDALSGSFLKVQTLAGGEGASLAFNFQGNDVTLNSANSVAAAVNWTGPTTSYFLDNKITGTAAGQTAFQFYTGASGDQAQVMISQNEIILGGANSIGVDVDTRSTSTIHVVANGIKFNNTNGTGVRMNLRKASGANVSGNEIIDNSGGATGILFENVEHLSTLVVNANKIDVSHASAFVDRGIVLTNVLNTDAVANPFVTFISTQSNTVLGATVPYSLPATGVKGTLLINDVSVE
ncbi:MAG TPA: inverse autotransporter beta domain-containing protein, partial [Planctomicrobium sp.]|nr:inverse autotransporter beta domain-containing protein [Planctomicrobium sp.]